MNGSFESLIDHDCKVKVRLGGTFDQGLVYAPILTGRPCLVDLAVGETLVLWSFRHGAKLGSSRGIFGRRKCDVSLSLLQVALIASLHENLSTISNCIEHNQI
jgi:hypothetical protein